MGELLSRLLSLSHPSNDSSPLKLSNMEAIKKKMQAMKVEKDNACDRVDASEEQCKAARLRASKAEDEVDELVTKSRQLETELDLTTEKLEEELRVVANNLKSLEVAEEKANQREKTYKEQIKTLTSKLKQAEARAEFAEKSVQKLQKEVDRLEDELVSEQEKYKAIVEELEQTFAEMSGY